MRWLIALVLAMLAAQSPVSTGRVTGVATDSAGGLIPGATITLRSAASERTTVTDARGAFSFDDVLPGRYAAVASLQGFYARPHTDIVVSADATVSLKFQLETDCLALVDYIDMGLAWVIKEADVIAHVRIELDRSSACAIANHCTCTRHQASVVRILKGQPPRELHLLQEGVGYASVERPYATGNEFIAFLKRDDTNHAFGRVAGPSYMFPVLNGRVQFPGRVPSGLRNGMTVAEFEMALRTVR